MKKIFLVLLISFLSACGSSPKTNFYQLSSDRSLNINGSNDISIGVWKVDLPELIDRPEIVTRTGLYTIDLADFHRWAGGLSSNVSLLIANELGHNLNTGQVDVSPWSSYRHFNYQIKVHIRKFDGEPGGESSLKGAYVILNGKGNKKLLEKTFSFQEKVKSREYRDMAAAMSQLVVQLSADISDAVSAQSKSKVLP